MRNNTEPGRTTANSEVHANTLDQLREWAEWKKNQKTRPQNAFQIQPKLPSKEKIMEMAKHYYPMRADAILNVFDFGENSCKRTKVRFADIETCMLHSFSFIDLTNSFRFDFQASARHCPLDVSPLKVPLLSSSSH
jgi:hypothetical protein